MSRVPQTSAEASACPAPDAPPCPRCGGDLRPWTAPEDAVWRCSSCRTLHFEGACGDYIDEFLSNWRPAWWAGAIQPEVFAFSLSSANPPDGSGIPGLDDQELRRLLAVARHRLTDPKARTAWVIEYARKLLAESRARRAS